MKPPAIVQHSRIGRTNVARVHIYADEAGNFDFSRGQSASRYFILTTVVLEDHGVCNELLDLRRELVWQGQQLKESGAFHATVDFQAVRDEVYKLISAHSLRIDATIIDKPKAQPQIRTTEERFYQYAWFYHFKTIGPIVIPKRSDALIVAASIGTVKKREAFHRAVQSVVTQVSPGTNWKTASWPAATDPGLQIADYCCWAIQRKWEGGDARSHQLIQPQLRSEFDLFRLGRTTHY
ncbi:MAG: DUF3800 domain-containing protein [Chloroflexi bacterium]|nr:DUF3800 domain-containing protein [Chloroflexota bacterium]